MQPVYNNQGGFKNFTQQSGTALANDVLIQSGGGRLNQLLQLRPMTSGQEILFYDSAIATSGGPFVASGHKIVGVLPATNNTVLSGQPQVFAANCPFPVNMPFNSGLVAATRSGTTGFSASYTMENLPFDQK